MPHTSIAIGASIGTLRSNSQSLGKPEPTDGKAYGIEAVAISSRDGSDFDSNIQPTLPSRNAIATACVLSATQHMCQFEDRGTSVT